MTSEEIQMHLTAIKEELQSQDKIFVEQQKEIYSKIDNFESHENPNFEQYLYVNNPHLQQDLKGIPKSSAAGTELESINAMRNSNLANIGKINDLQGILHYQPDRNININFKSISSDVNTVASFLNDILKEIEIKPEPEQRRGMTVHIEEREEFKDKVIPQMERCSMERPTFGR
jgi:hypothetical protein